MKGTALDSWSARLTAGGTLAGLCSLQQGGSQKLPEAGGRAVPTQKPRTGKQRVLALSWARASGATRHLLSQGHRALLQLSELVLTPECSEGCSAQAAATPALGNWHAGGNWGSGRKAVLVAGTSGLSPADPEAALAQLGRAAARAASLSRGGLHLSQGQSREGPHLTTSQAVPGEQLSKSQPPKAGGS